MQRSRGALRSGAAVQRSGLCCVVHKLRSGLGGGVAEVGVSLGALVQIVFVELEVLKC